MILVKTKIGPSKLHGIGLFADQFIPKGTITWEYHPKFDASFTEDDVKSMSEPSRNQFLHYSFVDKESGKHVLCFDDQRFINHSKELANIDSTPHRDIAAKDINIGEEMICDYTKFEETYFERRGAEIEKLD